MAARRLSYLLALLLCGLFALIYWDYIAALLFWFVLLLPLPLFLVNLLASFFVRVGLETASLAAPRGTPAELRLYVENRSPFPISSAKLTVRLQNRYDPEGCMTERMVFPIAASGRTLLTLKPVSEHCGPVKITAEWLTLFDWLGVTAISKRCRLHARLSVLPEVFDWTDEQTAPAAQGLEGDGYSAEKRGDDPSQIFDYHEYREGDKLKDIHWKLSARLDRLMVKEFSLPEASKTAVALEFSKQGGLAALDRAIAAAASASARLWTIGVSHELLWYSEEASVRRLPIRREEDFFTALSELYREEPAAGQPLLTELALKSEQTPYAQIYYAAPAAPEPERWEALNARLTMTLLQPEE